YSTALVKASAVKASILAHPEFTAFATASTQPFNDWASAAALDEIAVGEKPKDIIHRIAEDLLNRYSSVPLLSKYDVYQILMDYWADTLQDDLYLITQDGWQAAAQLRELVADKSKQEKIKEQPDLVIGKSKYKAELIAPALIAERFFSSQLRHIEQLQTNLDSATQELESFIEENSSEDGLLNDALNDKDKITAASVKARLKLATDAEEQRALKQCSKLRDVETEAKKALKTAQDELDLAIFQ